MIRLYRKNELAFSLIWIALYVVLFSLADNLSLELGTAKIVTVPVCVVMIVFLIVWIVKNGLCEKYGLAKTEINYRKYLYFLPLVLIASTNLWGGVALRLSVLETVLYVISMLCVGFIEELIFRGFLFKAICRENVKRAILISSITFGFGHIVNLLNNAETLATLLQICYATAIGFLFTIIFYKSKSLLPCVFTHSTVNVLSAFAREGSQKGAILVSVALIMISVLYAVWILNQQKADRENI